MAGKNAKGSGTIRKRSDGRWEARCTTGIAPKTGKQIPAIHLRENTKRSPPEADGDHSGIGCEDLWTYQAPCKMTVDEWLDIWLKDYQIGVKLSTAYLYERQAALYLRPELGMIQLEALKAHTIQHLYNKLFC